MQVSDLRKWRVRQSRVGGSPVWKWTAFLALVSCAIILWLWKPAPGTVKVELLTFSTTPPAWNGSYPFLTVSFLLSESDHVTFKSAILLIQPTLHHETPINEFQIDLHSGIFVLRQTDLFIPDSMPLALTRTYKGWDYETRARDFGLGTNHPYNICPTGTRFPYTYQDLNLEDARRIHFSRVSKGTSYADAVFRHDETSSEFFGAQDAWNGDGWTLSFPDGRRLLFPEAYKAKTFYQGAPYEMQDGSGHRIQLKRDEQRKLKQLISPSGHTISFKYDSADRIIEAADDAG